MRLLSVLLCALIIAVSCVAAVENYRIHVQQGTGEWNFISFYPLALSVRPNDTVTFTQDFDVGLIALSTVPVSVFKGVADPSWIYWTDLSVPTDDAETGSTVLTSPWQTASAGILYAPDVIASQGITGGRSNWTFVMAEEGIYTFRELFQDMTIAIEVTSDPDVLVISAAQTESLTQEKMTADIDRIPSLMQKYIEPLKTPTKDSTGNWIVNTGFIEPADPDPMRTGFGVYNRFVPGPTMTVEEGDIIYFFNMAKHPHGVSFNGTGEYFRPLLPFVYDSEEETWKQTAVYENPTAIYENGQPVFNGSNFVSSGQLAAVNGAGFPLKFTSVATYRYVCFLHIHLEMEAIITVVPRGSLTGTTSAAASLFGSLPLLLAAVIALVAVATLSF